MRRTPSGIQAPWLLLRDIFTILLVTLGNVVVFFLSGMEVFLLCEHYGHKCDNVGNLEFLGWLFVAGLASGILWRLDRVAAALFEIVATLPLIAAAVLIPPPLEIALWRFSPWRDFWSFTSALNLVAFRYRWLRSRPR